MTGAGFWLMTTDLITVESQPAGEISLQDTLPVPADHH
jgi:hypothetical protein